ncbi:hypothetical protein GH714_000758 [Hevea brasiliensis]|uniref:NAD(P)-binding domain-containing protein n=1 Tax=Hevea brasiliensis TaxID=3981 RepID=A0A6A6N635_HEVBR|nr:hypothetical protein GH714_000758 [Hevea brasiliensis]
MDTIYCNFIDAVPVVRYCTRKKKRLIQFSSCEVYGKTIGSFLTEDHPLRENLLRGESLELVEGGHSKRTFCYIKDAIEALLLMIENPEKANGHSFNVGNPNNEVSVKELANLMIEVYANVSGQPASNFSTVDVSSDDFYGIGYDDCDRRIPDMTLIHRQLGWIPMTSLQEILEVTLRYQHETYSEAVKHATSES